MSYEQVMNEVFNEELERLVGELSPCALLSIPGVYEVLAEYFNNEVLEALSEDEDG